MASPTLKCSAASGLTFVCIALACRGVVVSEEIEKGQAVTIVRAEDIGKSVVIQGRLGHPLGTLIRVRGKWTDPGFKDFPILAIEIVNGKQLDKRVLLRPGQVEQIHRFRDGRNGNPGEPWDWHFDWTGQVPSPKPVLGQTWEMVGVETGAFDQHSDDAWKEVGGPFVGMPSYKHDFWSRFEFIAVKIETEKLR